MEPQRVASIQAEEKVLTAARRMRENRVGCLIVNDLDGRMVGIISERDILRRIVATSGDLSDETVRDAMTAQVASCPAGTPINKASEIMTSHRIRHLPVVQDGRAIGIISVRDVMAEQLERDRAMRAAAERVAMLSTCLKSLDFDEVVDMVVSEVPKLFQADRCVLCLPGGPEAGAPPELVRRHNCPCPDRALRQRDCATAEDGRAVIACDGVPELCEKLGSRAPTLCIPLEVSGLREVGAGSAEPTLGYLCMCGVTNGLSCSTELLEYKASLVQEILNANLTNARLYQEVRRRSITDTLTGVGTRRVFEEALEAECLRANRYESHFCVAIVDVDHFKLINDKLGHAAGDRALTELGHCMMHQKRASDVLARYGGDEFVLLMPETEIEDAIGVCERIRLSVAELCTSEGVSMTVSCGVVGWSRKDKETANELVRRADMALYEAKRTGRNRTVTWKGVYADRLGRDPADDPEVKALEERVAAMSVQTKEMFIQSIWGLVRALEARDPYTKNHSENVMRYAVGIAETLGLAGEEVDVIRRGAMIHDIGKIGVPDSILRKPGELTPAERRIMEQHPLISVRILDQMRFLERELPIVRHHHERWDGNGYPDGLGGEDIPRIARILAVADAFDAITSDRIYRKGRPLPEAVEIMREESGAQFDPEVVAGMLQWVDRVQEALPEPEQLTAAHLLADQDAGIVAA